MQSSGVETSGSYKEMCRAECEARGEGAAIGGLLTVGESGAGTAEVAEEMEAAMGRAVAVRGEGTEAMVVS